MSFDEDTRSALSKMVTACRRLLTEDITNQLGGQFGMHPDGTILPIDRLDLAEDEKAAAMALRELLSHFGAGEASRADERRRSAYDRLVLELSFTTLNRLAGLRLCEERGLVVECVRKGTASDGFRLFDRVSGGALGTRYQTYRVFLDGIFAELALDLGVLFDRTTPQSKMFPSERCLDEVLTELNKPKLAHLWVADETIGWIYQYFNPPEERKAMRDASQAPRNSRELAVRNQFFTPRYVVEFLTDNSLGRIWYEMRKGETALKEECRYLVLRPTEVFLGPRDGPPPSDQSARDVPQEQLLKQPVYIEHRPKKDPRKLSVLDPACGSGHFLLYAFDLLERIYEEAWQDPESPIFEATGRTLRADFATIEDLRRAVPKLVIEHNLHGIEIDPRAVQIAALALWLRAQSAWKGLGLKAPERPRVERSNIVTAEPMPGEEDMRREFTAGLRPRVLGQLVDAVFAKMELAGEAGSLLKIEEEITAAVAAAKTEYVAEQRRRRDEVGYLPGMAPPHQGLLFDFTDLSEEEFWGRAENLIFAALESYAEGVESGGTVRRRLFVQDAASGFAFIHLSRQRYDVVLMNPPFGRRSEPSRAYFDEKYGSFKSDMGLAFVDRFAAVLAPGGQLGALTSRTFLAGGSFTEWRRDSLLSKTPIRILLDLGIGVLDDALVETCAYVLQRTRNPLGWFLRALEATHKEQFVNDFFGRSRETTSSHGCEFLTSLADMRRLPTSIIAYWLPPDFMRRLDGIGTLASIQGATKHGVQTTDDFQFYRLAWEVPAGSTTQGGRWPLLAKGGEYAPFFDNLHLCVDWLDNGSRLKAYLAAKRLATQGSPDWTPWMNSYEDYFKPGLTFPARTASDYCPRVLPAGCVFTASGQALLFRSTEHAYGYLGGAFSRSFKVVVDAFVCSGDNSVSGSAANTYRTGLVNLLPLPTRIESEQVQELGRESVELARRVMQRRETSLEFCPAGRRGSSLREFGARIGRAEYAVGLRILEIAAQADRYAREFLGFTDESLSRLHGPLPTSYPKREVPLDTGVLLLPEEGLVGAAVERHGPRRQLTKKVYSANRRLELLCHLLELHPQVVVSELDREECWPLRGSSAVEEELSFYVGCTLGRWDIRIALDLSLAPRLADPFASLPMCAPGMMVGPEGLPATPGRIVSEAWLRSRPNAVALPPDGSIEDTTIPDSDYPLRVSWDGILVDDPGFNGGQPHRDDILRRVREVIELLWRDKAQCIEEEACESLGVTELRDYFRRPAAFFQDHLKRYSQSRRQAPIYWPLSTASGAYTIWLYYHRLTDQTLYAAVNKYLEPKITEVEHAVAQIEQELDTFSGPEATRLRDRLSGGRSFGSELRDLRAELLRIAALPYKPNLNDGVIINAAPFHKLFRLRSWATDTKEVWKTLENGDYDWAHFADSVWPERVMKKCRKDRSIAIAHGLEELCEVEPCAAKGRGKRTDRKEGAAGR